MKLIVKFSTLFLIVLFIFSCEIPMIYIGIPYAFDGHYKSQNPVLDNKNFLYMRVSSGGLTVYFGKDNLDNIQGLDYDKIKPINIESLEENNYVFRTDNMYGEMTFRGDTTVIMKLYKIAAPTFSIENSVLEKVNSF